MHILLIGLNHETAPVHLREQFFIAKDELSLATRRLRNQRSILESVIISTCNRLELYVVCDQLHTGEYYTQTFLADWFSIDKPQFSPFLYIKHDQQAIQHLFSVICGLNSLIIGETQILGQVKDSFILAQQSKTTGTLFNCLFKQAVTFGKSIHTNTTIGQHAVSISYAAVELGRKLFQSFCDKTILLVGAGEMIELTAKYFQELGVKQIIIINRTFERAVELAVKFRGEARLWAKLVPSLSEVDIVITSTGAAEPVITYEMVESTLTKRVSPLFIIDIAVPRDVEPALHHLENVFLYNIDDLQGIIDVNQQLRTKEALKVRELIDVEVTRYGEWLGKLGVFPLLGALRSKALHIQAETQQRLEHKLPELTEHQKRIIRKHTKSIVNQLLRDPIIRLKELAAGPEQTQVLNLFQQLFDLELDDMVGNNLWPTANAAKTKQSRLPLKISEEMLAGER